MCPGRSLLMAMMTLPTPGNKLALHFGVGPQNAVLCLLMAGLLICTVDLQATQGHAGLDAAVSLADIIRYCLGSVQQLQCCCNVACKW